MGINAFRNHRDNGGRVSLLFLLFLLAIYEFVTAGFSAFAIICLSPILVLSVISTFHYRLFIFWALIIINNFLQMKDVHLPVPMSLPNEMLEIIILALAIIDVEHNHFSRAAVCPDALVRFLYAASPQRHL